jgi:uncharacterized membrane protein YgdD (TMEM256/DUF423 family)
VIAGILGATGVTTGALAAHALENSLSVDDLATFETASRYQVYHALALLGVAWSRTQWGGRLTTFAGVSFSGGVVLFSGSLYLLALTDVSIFGAVAPLGGASLIAGWVFLGLSGFRRPLDQNPNGH